MKGVGWIVVLLSLLGVVYLVTRDLESLQGTRDEKTVMEPLERAKEATDALKNTQRQLDEGLRNADK